MAMALRENGKGKLYSIDPHISTAWSDADSPETYDAFRDNIRRLGVSQFVEIIRKPSEEAATTWRLPIDVLFIDGDHSYDAVKADWNGFSPQVTEFGIVVFHDTVWDIRPDMPGARPDMGVPKFVDELRRQGYPVLTLDRDFGVTLVQPTRLGIPLVKSPQQRDG
jgi:predicted O-methyltransferase YrrM